MTVKILSFKNILILMVIGLPFVLVPLLRNSTKSFTEYEPVLIEQFGEDALYSHLSIYRIENLGNSLNVIVTRSPQKELRSWSYFNREWKEGTEVGMVSELAVPALSLDQINLAVLDTVKADTKARLEEMGVKARFYQLELTNPYDGADRVIRAVYIQESLDKEYTFEYSTDGVYLGRSK